MFERILHYQEGRKEPSSEEERKKEDLEQAREILQRVVEGRKEPSSEEERKKEQDLEQAREILKRVMERDLYRCVGQAKVCSYVFMCLY